VIVADDFNNFLSSKIKVDGKAGKLGTKVKISRDSAKFIIHAELPFSKRYLKYLTKKYLKREDLKNFLRVVASNTSRDTYEVKYYKVDGGDAEEAQ